MSAPGRPKREYRSAQHEGSPASDTLFRDTHIPMGPLRPGRRMSR